MRSHAFSHSGLVGLIGTLGVVAAVPACALGHQSTGTTQDNLVINPVGSENESHITLQLPTDACSPGASCAKVLGVAPTLFIDSVGVALGGNTRLKPGAHNIAVNNVGYQVTTKPGQNLSITLPVADTKCTNASLPGIPKTDFGGTVTVTNAPCPTSAQGSAVGVPARAGAGILYYYSGCGSYVAANPASSFNCSGATTSYNYNYISSSGVCTGGGVGPAGCLVAQAGADANLPGNAILTTAYEAYAPGTLSATVNGTAQTLTLSPGDEVDFNISLPALGTVPATFATNITFLDPRANPDAARGTITSSCSGDSSYTIPSATGTPAPLDLNAFVNSACTYTLTVGGRTLALSQTTTNAINLNRLDVDNVTITREDGSTYTTTGAYTLNYGGVQVAGPYNTGTGIDVIPGTYQFSLSYTDFDGPQTFTQTLTF